MEDSDKYRKNPIYSIKYFILSFLILFSISFIVLFVIEKQVRSVQFEEIKDNEKRVVSFQNDFIGDNFNMILADLHYLHHAFEDDLEDPKTQNKVALNWRSFSTQRDIYDQIRYIDIAGDEKIRINLDEDGAYIIPDQDLQNKKDRYYFYETVELDKEVVHVSQMDLNIEFNKIEKPYKPMIRFSTPIYDDYNNTKGIIVLNFLAERLLDNFREVGMNSMGEVSLLNSESFWLSSEYRDLEWGFMFEDQKSKNFKSEYPKEWEKIVESDGQIISSNGLFTFSKVNLQHAIKHNKKIYEENLHLKDGDWYIVSLIKRDGAHKDLFIDNNLDLMGAVIRDNKLYFLLIFLISIVLASLVYINRKTYAKIKYYSEFDTLTNIYNRRAGISKLNQLFPLDDRRHFVASLCFIDVNGLKQVNDTLGHKYGDELIITVVDVIKATIREQDFIVRMGGDEFLVVFNGVDTNKAEEIWKRIKSAYDKINDQENRPYMVSVSHGIVSNKTSQRTEVDSLIKLADEKMYEEKRIIKENLDVIR